MDHQEPSLSDMLIGLLWLRLSPSAWAYEQWLKYDIGFTGQGPTVLDVPPASSRPKRVPSAVQRCANAFARQERNRRWQVFCEVAYEVTGEVVD